MVSQKSTYIFTLMVNVLIFLKTEVVCDKNATPNWSNITRHYPHFNLTYYVISHGYDIKVHENIVTEDGYLLTLHRISHGRNISCNSKHKAVAFLMHGLGGTAANWVSGGPHYAPALLLADMGYDVWLGNARGSTHSKKHLTLDPVQNKSKFWDFSWHEIGYYDLYANINYILNVTQQQQLFYIGHSQGSTVYFVLMATRPEMNEKIKLMAALAPAVYGTSIPLSKFLAYGTFSLIDSTRLLLGMYTDPFGRNMENFACKSNFTNEFICGLFLDIRTRFMGIDSSKTRLEHWEIIKQIFPDSCSFKQIMHYVQVGLTDEFSQYHLGTFGNLWKYGTLLPPLYDLSQVTSPVAIFYGENDIQVTPESVERLKHVLPNIVDMNLIPEYSHADFLVDDSAVDLVYKKIFELMLKYA